MARRAAPQAPSRVTNTQGGAASLQAVLQAARSTGTLDLSDRCLTELPREVFYFDELPQPAAKVSVERHMLVILCRLSLLPTISGWTSPYFSQRTWTQPHAWAHLHTS